MTDKDILISAAAIMERTRRALEAGISGILTIVGDQPGAALALEPTPPQLALGPGPEAPPKRRGKPGREPRAKQSAPRPHSEPSRDPATRESGGSRLCPNPDCGQPFTSRFRTGPRRSRVCGKAACKKWWIRQRDATKSGTQSSNNPPSRRGRKPAQPLAQFQSSQRPNGLSATAAQIAGLSPRDALFAYARLHGGRILVAEAVVELKASGVFAGNSRAVTNNAIALLENAPEFTSEFSDGRVIYALEGA